MTFGGDAPQRRGRQRESLELRRRRLRRGPTRTGTGGPAHHSAEQAKQSFNHKPQDASQMSQWKGRVQRSVGSDRGKSSGGQRRDTAGSSCAKLVCRKYSSFRVEESSRAQQRRRANVMPRLRTAKHAAGGSGAGCALREAQQCRRQMFCLVAEQVQQQAPRVRRRFRSPGSAAVLG